MTVHGDKECVGLDQAESPRAAAKRSQPCQDSRSEINVDATITSSLALDKGGRVTLRAPPATMSLM